MSSHRVNYSSGAQWEDIVGYSRAVKCGNVLEISGTVAIDEYGNLIGENDAYLQAKFILQKIETVLIQAELTFNDVVRTRIYVTDIKKWEEIALAHREVFELIKPCTTMVEVKNLIKPEFLVEIEATAIIS